MANNRWQCTCNGKTCVECASRRLAALVKEVKKSWPAPEYDWEDLAKQAKAVREHGKALKGKRP